MIASSLRTYDSFRGKVSSRAKKKKKKLNKSELKVYSDNLLVIIIVLVPLVSVIVLSIIFIVFPKAARFDARIPTCS